MKAFRSRRKRISPVPVHPALSQVSLAYTASLAKMPDAVSVIAKVNREIAESAVARADIQSLRLGVRFFDLHASGSFEMMERTHAEVSRACRREGIRRPKILAVTVLTSLRAGDLRRVGVADEMEHHVIRLARLARRAGMDGVVASPLEIGRIRRECGRSFLIVTPGVRPARSDHDDQKRIMTPEAAMRAGADYLVIGRPIRDAADPRAAARQVVADMARGFVAARARPAVRV